MELAPDTWYSVVDLLDAPSIQLRDGSAIHPGTSTFFGSHLRALTASMIFHRRRVSPGEEDPPPHFRHQLQIQLHNVDRHDVAHLPAPPAISRKLLHEHLLYLPQCRYGWDLLIANDDRSFRARGAVCLALTLDGDYGSIIGLAGKTREVRGAWQRGLLDDFGKAKADFRLDIKPMMHQLIALMDADYLPEDVWQVDVLFGYWFDEAINEFFASPLPDTATDAIDLDNLKLKFLPRLQRRDFKITDLFRIGT